MPTARPKIDWTQIYYRIYARFDAAAVADSLYGRCILWLAGLTGRAMHTIGIMKDKPWFARRSMRSVRSIMPEVRQRKSDVFPLPDGVESVSDLRVASILDHFSQLSFSFDCDLLPLSTVDWKQRIEEFHPHLLLVESAWQGSDESWKWKVSIVSPELVELIVWCRRHDVPTVFWNKEDPHHFNTFIRTAELFDVVFTTDLDIVPEYQKRMGGGRTYYLPFAAQPAIHNPIETYERSEGFCFAGSYYRHQIDRNRGFARMVDELSKQGNVVIYDRYLNTLDERLTFPKRFEELIIGTLEPEDIDRAYKGYYYGLNMNSVISSQTMFARRAIELLASNTVVVGNYSRGIRDFLGSLTISTDDVEILGRMVMDLRHDDDARDRYRLAGLRKVMSQHTYRHRLQEIVEKVFHSPLTDNPPEVTVVSDPSDAKEVDAILTAYNGQSYPNKKLVLLVHDDLDVREEGFLIMRPEVSPSDIVGICDLVAYMCPADGYGPEYLTDLVLGQQWSKAEVVGKGTFMDARGVAFPGREYRFIDSVAWRMGLASRSVAIEALGSLLGNRSVNVSSSIVLSLDRFSYVYDGAGLDCSRLEASVTDDGLDQREVVSKTAKGRTFLNRTSHLRAYGRYPRPGQPFGAPYLHARQSSEGRTDVICSGPSTSYYEIDGIEVGSISQADMGLVFDSTYQSISVHLIDRSLGNLIINSTDHVPTEIWIYGPEAELALYGTVRDSGQGMSVDEQMNAHEWKRLAMTSHIRFVLSSKHLKDEFERKGFALRGDVRIAPVTVEDVFLSTTRRQDGEVRILVAEPFWGAELDVQMTIEILKEMARSPAFRNAKVTAWGNWKGKGLEGPMDIDFVSNILRTSERADLFCSHTILLMPLHRDLNCAMPLEAMAAGMVLAITPIGAVTEYVSSECAVMLSGDLIKDSECLIELCQDTIKLDQMSKKARERMGDHLRLRP